MPAKRYTRDDRVRRRCRLQARLDAAERSAQARQREIDALYRISALTLSEQPLHAVLQDVAREISAATAVPLVVIEIYDEARQLMELAAATGSPLLADKVGLCAPVDQTLSGYVARSGQTAVDLHTQDHSEYADLLLRQVGLQTYVCLPLSAAERVVGTLTLAHPGDLLLDEQFMPLAYSLANLVAVLIMRRQAEERSTDLTQQLGAILDTLADPRGAEKLMRSDLVDIIAHSQAEADLQVALTKYRTLFDAFPLGITVSDAAGQIVETNPMAERLLGIGREEHDQRKIDSTEWRIVRPDGSLMPADEYASVRALKENRVVENVEMGIITPRGETTWINVTAAPLPLENYGVVITYGDITTRKQAETALRHSEHAFRTLYEHMRDAFVSVDMQGTIRQYNRSFQELLGYTDEELILLTYRDITPEQWHAVEARIVQEEILPQGYSGVYEKEYRRKDGSIVPIELRTVLTNDAQGRPTGMWAIIRDITVRRNTEDRLQRLQAVTASFAASQTRAEVDRVILDEVGRALGAQAIGLRLVRAGQLILEDLTRSIPITEETLRRHSSIPLTAHHPATDVVRTGVARFHRDVADIVQGYPDLAEAARAIPAQANAHLPLTRGDEVFGVLSLHFTAPRQWDEGERAFALALADRTAVAYERARLFEAERRARARAERLLTVTAALSRTMTPDEVYNVVLQYGVTGGSDADTALVAHSGTFFVLVGTTLTLASWSGFEHPLLAQYWSISLDASVPAATAARTAQPVWLRSQADYIRQYPNLEDQIRQLSTEAGVSLPLIVEGRVLGVITFTFDEPLAFDADEQGFLRMLAAQAAQALDRSRLFVSLQESEQRFRALSDSGILGVFFSNGQGEITAANPAFLNLLGLTPNDLRDRITWQASTPPEWAEQDAEKSRQMITYGSVAPYEKEYLRADGTRVPVLVGATLVGDVDLTAVAVVLDITKRKQAESALRQSEALLSAVLDALPVGVIIADADGKIVRDNAANTQIWGVPPQMTSWEQYGEWVGYWPATGARIQAHEWTLARALRTGDVITGELVECQPFDSSERRFCLNNAAPVRDGTGAIIAGVVAELDVTEARQIEAAIIRRSAQLQQLADAATRINAARDVAAIIQLVTAEARTLIGAHCAATQMTADARGSQTISAVSRSEQCAQLYGDDQGLDGRELDTLVCQTNRPLRLTQAALENHPAWKGVSAQAGAHQRVRGWLAVPLVGRDGRNLGLIQLSAKIEDEFSADDEAMLVQLAQLTAIALENQQLLTEEQQARAAAEAAVRLREQFLSIASHELRTPLTSILGYAQIFQRRAESSGTLSERDQRNLHQIIAYAERLNRMIATILDVSRIDQGRLQLDRAPINLTALIHETVIALQGTAPHHLVVVAPEPPLWVDGDALRLEQVLHNLLGNAIKYSPGGGTVTVTVTADSDSVLVAVHDEGIGIPAQDLPHIFERFYRAGNVSADTISGVGIGLFVVHEIVTLHGGTITVTSAEGVGSTFTLSLPRTAPGSG